MKKADKSDDTTFRPPLNPFPYLKQMQENKINEKKSDYAEEKEDTNSSNHQSPDNLFFESFNKRLSEQVEMKHFAGSDGTLNDESNYEETKISDENLDKKSIKSESKSQKDEDKLFNESLFPSSKSSNNSIQNNNNFELLENEILNTDQFDDDDEISNNKIKKEAEEEEEEESSNDSDDFEENNSTDEKSKSIHI